MSWSTSTRRARLPRDWPTLVAATKCRAHGRCEGVSLRGEPRWHVSDCDHVGTDCDHDKRGDDHSLANLRWLSRPCHQAKTQHEAQSSRGVGGRRQPPRHPSEGGGHPPTAPRSGPRA